MEDIISALIPIFLLILVGYYFKYINFPINGFWNGADKLTYYVLMPTLLVYKLSNVTLQNNDYTSYVISALMSIVVIFLFLLIIQKIMKYDNSSFTSIMQGSIRFNTYVFLALVNAIFSDIGLVLAILLITFVIPLINLLCITTFSIYTQKDKFSINKFLKSIFYNPLIIACIIGGTINYTGINIPIVINHTLNIISQAALPMGLISVGVGLSLKELSSTKNELFTASIIKLIISPIVFYIMAYLFEINDILIISILIIFASMPTAPSAYILARQLGGDTKLMSSLISVQTLLAIITLSFIILQLQ